MWPQSQVAPAGQTEICGGKQKNKRRNSGIFSGEIRGIKLKTSAVRNSKMCAYFLGRGFRGVLGGFSGDQLNGAGLFFTGCFITPFMALCVSFFPSNVYFRFILILVSANFSQITTKKRQSRRSE